VIVINPFGLFLDSLPRLESVGWNPMLQLDPESSDFEDGARCIASAWAEKSADGSGNSRFFELSADNLSTALIMWERISKRDAARLYNIRSILSEPTIYDETTKTPKSGFLHTLFEMSTCKYPAVVNIARRLLSRLTDRNSQSTAAQDVIDTVLANTRFLDNPAIRDDMDIGGAIDFASLRRKITTIYFALPPDQLEGECAKYLRIFVNLALQQLYKNPRPIEPTLPPVLFMLDEFANLGKLSEITRALTISRDYGVQLAMFCHHIGQLRANYPDVWPSFFTGSGAITTFRTGDAETPEYLCKLYGNREEQVTTENLDGGMSNTPHDVPLIRPEDVGRLGRGETISLIEPCPMPIKAAAPVYSKTPYGARLDPNPYYRG
jgi:type IV secretion system protein VirD4